MSASGSAYRGAVSLLVGAVLFVALWTYWRGGELFGANGADQAQWTGMNLAGAAPAFRAPTLSGREINFPEDYRGKLVLVDFWATWCPPCRAEFPHLREAYEKFHERGLEVVGVSLDAPNGISAGSVRDFLRKQEAKWEVVYENAGAIANAYGVQGIPAPFLLDGDTGAVLARDGQLRGRALQQTIDKALSEK